MDKVSILRTSAFRRDEALGYFQRVLDLATATLSNYYCPVNTNLPSQLAEIHKLGGIFL